MVKRETGKYTQTLVFEMIVTDYSLSKVVVYNVTLPYHKHCATHNYCMPFGNQVKSSLLV